MNILIFICVFGLSVMIIAVLLCSHSQKAGEYNLFLIGMTINFIF